MLFVEHLRTCKTLWRCGWSTTADVSSFLSYNDEDNEVGDDGGGGGDDDDDQRHICGGLLRLVDNLTQKPETM